MHAFLKRHGKKGGARGKTGGKASKSEGPIGVLKYQDAVSKSMDSLLMVVSSVPLPPEAKLTVDPYDPAQRANGRKRRRRVDPHHNYSEQDLPSMERRHSYEYALGIHSDDEDNQSDTGVSRSAEVSPRHASRNRSDSTDSGREMYRMMHHSILSSLGQSGFASDHETEPDSEDDKSYVSVQTSDSQVFVVTDAHGNVAEDSSPRVVQSGTSLAAELQQEALLRQRRNALMEHPFFLLDIQLHDGKDLVVRDSCGTSDPYVKFKIGGKQLYKSRTVYKNLNPKWDETFTLAIEDINKPINVKVYDYDRGLHDDPMGSAELDCSQLEIGKTTDLKLMLSERGKAEYMGYLNLTCTLIPKTQEDKDQFLRRSVRSNTESTKKIKMQSWSGVLTIVLVEGVDLVPMDDNGLSDPYVKFRLGNEKYRSKHKSKSLHPKWLEQFDLRLFDDQSSQLEISVYDYDVTGRDDFMGRATVDISKLETEVTHNMEVELEDGAGMIRLLMTISGTIGHVASSDLAHFTPDSNQHVQMARRYSILRSLNDFRDVGHLQIKVFKAVGLKSMDIGGHSDPFCVLELVNARVQTHTEYKTLNPEWNKVFTFKVRDIHSVLEVTVYDEDRDKKVEFLGKVAIPLLRIKSGERRWYALKDKKLIHRTKGAILLEMELFYNNVKAAVRTVNPREEKFMEEEPKFKIHLMKRNIDRVSQLVSVFMDTARFLRSCFQWESKPRSLTAFIAFLVIVWNFELYMLPISILLIFLKNLVIAQVIGAFKREPVEDDYFDEDDDEDEEDKDKNAKSKEEKKTFKEKLQSIQDVCLQVQQAMDTIATLGERVKNTFNWSVPWLSTLAVLTLTAGAIVLYFIPLRYLLLAWGINKFTKKLRKPNALSNNELLDFLSRVPSDEQLIQYRELRPELTSTPGKKKRQ